MKGPSERLKYDLLRVWECPECHHRCRTGGDITAMWCDCTENQNRRPTPMKLLEDGIRRRVVSTTGDESRPGAFRTEAQSQQ